MCIRDRYFNGISDSKNPFPRNPIDNGLIGDDYAWINSTRNHFGFKHPSVSKLEFMEGRDGFGSLDHSLIGQINEIVLETGAYFKYDYELSTFPFYYFSPQPTSEPTKIGVRLKTLEKGSGNGPSQLTTYESVSYTHLTLPTICSV